MPDRILRAELLTSEAWLACKSNDDRVCWIALLPSVDTFGNMPAGPYRLIHLWRPYGIETPEKVAKVLAELVDVDLIRRYVAGGKAYLHIPRFRQSRRYLGKLWPLSPWTTEADKARVYARSPVDNNCISEANQEDMEKSLVNHGEPPRGVGVGVGVGVKSKTLSDSASPASDVARRILQFLNDHTGHHYRPTSNTLKPILARLKEGFSEIECRAVIVRRTRAWRGDDKMRDYLRPATLFGAEKFAQYVGEVPPDNSKEKPNA